MKLCRSLAVFGFAASLLLVVPRSRAEDAADDSLKSKNLVKSGTTYVLPVEQEMADGMKNLRKVKAKLDSMAKQRRDLESNLKTAKNTMSQWEYQRRTLLEQYTKLIDVTQRNNAIAQITLLESKLTEGEKARADLEKQLSALGSEEKTDFINQVIALGQKVDAAQDEYKDLNADADVKSTLERLNVTSKPKMKLGPTPEFTANLNQFKRWRNDVSSDVIPIKNENEVHTVEVTFNGSVTRQVIVDSGASMVCLTAALAEQLKMVPSEKDETLTMRIADGNLIQAKHMVIKSVRVGQFTVTDVDCAVLPKDLVSAEALLGGTFLNNFIFKIDPKAGEMHLSVIAGNPKVTTIAASKDPKKLKVTGAGDSK